MRLFKFGSSGFAPKGCSTTNRIHRLFLPPSLFITKDVEHAVMCGAERHHSLVVTLQCELTTQQVHQRASRMEGHVK